VLPFVGPEWGVCVTAPPAEAAWFPQVVAAVRVRPGDKAPPVDQALFAAVHALGQMAVLDYNGKNKDRMSLRTLFQGRTEVRYLEGGSQLPPGLRPAFALHDGYLVLASSPEAVRRFAGLGPARPAPTAEEFPLLRLSLKDLRQYVKDRREPLAQAVAEKNEIPRDEAERRLDGLLAGLQLLDRVELTQKPAPGQVTLSLRVRTALPLRK